MVMCFYRGNGVNDFHFQLACEKCFKDGNQPPMYNRKAKHMCLREFLIGRQDQKCSWFRIRPPCDEKPGAQNVYRPTLCRTVSKREVCPDKTCCRAHSHCELEVWKAHFQRKLRYAEVYNGLTIEFPLSSTHNFEVACVLCFTAIGSHAIGSFSPGYHSVSPCDKTILIVCKKGSNGPWMMVRQRVGLLYVGSNQLCRHRDKLQHFESFAEACFYAHNDEEQHLWTLEQWERFSFVEFLSSCRRSSLDVETFLKKYRGRFKFICRSCWASSQLCEKSRFQPLARCPSGHPWVSNKLLVYEALDGRLCTINDRCWECPSVEIQTCPNAAYCVQYGCKLVHSIVERDVRELTMKGITHETLVNGCTDPRATLKKTVEEPRQNMPSLSSTVNNAVPKSKESIKSPRNNTETVKQNVLSRSSGVTNSGLKPKEGTEFQKSSPASVKQKQRTANETSGGYDNDDVSRSFSVLAICESCWKNNGEKTGKHDQKNACWKGHSWKKCYLIKEKGQTVRKPPAQSGFWNYKMCHRYRNCPKGASCTFAHSEVELELWNWMVRHKGINEENIDKMLDLLYYRVLKEL